MTASTEEPTGKRTKWLIVKIAVGLACLGTAAYFALRPNPETQQIDTPESATPYVCLNDGHVFELTPAGFERLGKAGGIRGSREEGVRGQLMLQCPKCRQFKVVAGVRCPKDGTVVANYSPTGTPGCPKCGWQPGAG